MPTKPLRISDVLEQLDRPTALRFDLHPDEAQLLLAYVDRLERIIQTLQIQLLRYAP